MDVCGCVGVCGGVWMCFGCVLGRLGSLQLDQLLINKDERARFELNFVLTVVESLSKVTASFVECESLSLVASRVTNPDRLIHLLLLSYL